MATLTVFSGCGYKAKKLRPLNTQTASLCHKQHGLEIMAKNLSAADIDYYFQYKKNSTSPYPYTVVQLAITNTTNKPCTLYANDIAPITEKISSIHKVHRYPSITANHHLYPQWYAMLLLGSVTLLGALIPAVIGGHTANIAAITLVGIGTSLICLPTVGLFAYAKHIDHMNKQIYKDIKDKLLLGTIILEPNDSIEKLLFWNSASHNSMITIPIKFEKSSPSTVLITMPVANRLDSKN
jgi:hypothetical protein